ncbi:MAG: hypothetical protein ACLQIB_20620 [Isosphaeraceae bacterium]
MVAWGQRILRFEYAYAGLPALDGEQYATGENLLGVALCALMRLPADRRAELYAEGSKRIADSGENDFRRFLLAECLDWARPSAQPGLPSRSSTHSTASAASRAQGWPWLTRRFALPESCKAV